jgi:hypothetical protein
MAFQATIEGINNCGDSHMFIDFHICLGHRFFDDIIHSDNFLNPCT